MLDRLPRWLEVFLSALLSPISVVVAWVIYRERRPLCALAHARGWLRWRRFWGERHCAESWRDWTR